jgi:murein DD-endopeptidase MepM/ murein hydrolase activator NlpD
MGAADFNNDGKSDIMWRNFAGGQNTVWLMNGSNYIGDLDIPDVSDRNWTADNFSGRMRTDQYFAPGTPPPPITWDKPVTNYWVSQEFTGSTFYTNHTGIDLAANQGTRVEAAKNGTVIRAGWDTTGYGNLVVIDHGDGFKTYYAHLVSITVGVGQGVERNYISF